MAATDKCFQPLTHPPRCFATPPSGKLSTAKLLAQPLPALNGLRFAYRLQRHTWHRTHIAPSLQPRGLVWNLQASAHVAGCPMEPTLYTDWASSWLAVSACAFSSDMQRWHFWHAVPCSHTSAWQMPPQDSGCPTEPTDTTNFGGGKLPRAARGTAARGGGGNGASTGRASYAPWCCAAVQLSSGGWLGARSVGSDASRGA
mmetsp:Transcript_47476/g.133596  ORF Transcript_47476/g.133596 Transcript_47476/m.133596 type:complete len:201 (-) Transcript_47476:373-975(-)